MSTACLIWGTPAVESSGFGYDEHGINSPRAGGQYLVSRTVAVILDGCDDLVKTRLTSWLIEQRRLGNEWPEIYGTTISEARQRRDLRVSERGDGILRYLETRSNILGARIHYRVYDRARFDDKSFPSLSEEEKDYFGLLSHSACANEKDLGFLLDWLDERGLVKSTGPHDEVRGRQIRIMRCMLTVGGYERLATLDATNADSSKAFVAMWFDPSTHDVWEGGFKLAIREAGYEPMRIDQKEHVNKICDEIVAEIRRARFVVADFTHGDSGVRGGVYYEAGFAHGLGIPVIFTCQAKTLEEIHFDTRQFNHITWENPEELKEKLANRIAAVIGDGPFLN